MGELKLQIKIDNLNQRKRQLLLSLEWAIANNDKELHDASELELKIVLKKLKKLNKELNNYSSKL